MSGYVAIIAQIKAIPRIRPLLRDEEMLSIPLDENLVLMYYSTTKTLTGNQIFQGYAVDHEKKQLIFPGASPDDLPDPASPKDGSYFTARIEKETVTFGTDLNGYVSMCWFESPLATVISDSFLTLLGLRNALGLACSPNMETIAGRMWVNAITNSQVGTATFCEEITYCTPGTALTYDIPKGKTTQSQRNLVSQYKASFTSHSDAIHNTAARMIGVFRGFAETNGAVNLSLSGGTDSRACLAAALAAGIGEVLHIGSKDNGRLDYPIAVELSRKFGFPLNKPSPWLQGRLESRDPLSVWAGMNLGLYDSLYATSKFRRRKAPVFSVGGQGAELSKGNYGWRPVREISMPQEALSQAKEALAAIGLASDDPWESEWHYLAFRNPIHSGQALLNSDYVSRPCAQAPIIGLSRSELNQFPAPRKAQYNIIGDLLVYINPELALHRFDSRAKNFTPDRIARRLKALGGPLDPKDVTGYRLIGSALPSTGFLKSHTSIAESFGFAGDINGKNLWEKATATLSHFEEVIPDSILHLAKSINPEDAKTISSQDRGGTALGKLVSLYPLTVSISHLS